LELKSATYIAYYLPGLKIELLFSSYKPITAHTRRRLQDNDVNDDDVDDDDDDDDDVIKTCLKFNQTSRYVVGRS